MNTALSGCPAQDKQTFQSLLAYSQSKIESLGLCKTPELCVVPEAFECVNKYAAALSTFDRTQDLQALCQ